VSDMCEYEMLTGRQAELVKLVAGFSNPLTG
jgi:hypothetical protein